MKRRLSDVTAFQWEPSENVVAHGLEPRSLEVHLPTLHTNRQGTYFYLSGDLELRARAWLATEGACSSAPELIRLREVPFKERETLRVGPENFMAQRYVRRFGWHRFPRPFAFLVWNGKRELVEPGDWLFRFNCKDAWYTLPDKQFLETFE